MNYKYDGNFINLVSDFEETILDYKKRGLPIEDIARAFEEALKEV